MSAPEDIDGIDITFVGCGEVALTRENSGLYTFAGRNALYDHVFVQCARSRHRQIRGEISGHFMFASSDFYDLIRDSMLDLGYPHVHEITPQPHEIKAFDYLLLSQAETLADLFPDLA